MPKRLVDFVADCLADHGFRDVFLVTGGGAMHLNDALGHHPRLRYIACHHEQSCAMAAESYFRMSGRPAVVNVTTGPGGTNAITGVWGAWVDSQAMVVISGQVKWQTTVGSTPLPLRQLGDQEIDICRVVSSFTKVAEMVTDPNTIREKLERAIHLSTTGRPGPVWLDIPIDVQGALIEPLDLAGFVAAPETTPPSLETACRELLKRLAKAERPCVIAGGGIRASGTYDPFLRFVDRMGIPVATAWNAHDLIWDSHPLYVGRPGTVGDRAGNFAVQNSDFLLILGSRLNIRQVSYNWESFARAAFKVMVDIEQAELFKPTLKIDLPIQADLKDFFQLMEKLPQNPTNPSQSGYLSWCKSRQKRYPVRLPEYSASERVNPYVLADELFKLLPKEARVVTGDGTACVTTFQAAALKEGQRLYTNSGCAAMGYDLPAAIGGSVGLGGAEVICVTGDGSIMLNLQELQTIRTLNLPIKVLILNNGGYHSIRQTQANYFPGSPVGCGPESGLGFPDFSQIANAFGFPFQRIERQSKVGDQLGHFLNLPGRAICEVYLDPSQPFAPKLGSRKLPDGRMVSSPLEDLSPLLDRQELLENLLIPPWESAT